MYNGPLQHSGKMSPPPRSIEKERSVTTKYRASVAHVSSAAGFVQGPNDLHKRVRAYALQEAGDLTHIFAMRDLTSSLQVDSTFPIRNRSENRELGLVYASLLSRLKPWDGMQHGASPASRYIFVAPPRTGAYSVRLKW
jgi:hypothetical protein